jgi:hypothetical protein
MTSTAILIFNLYCPWLAYRPNPQQFCRWFGLFYPSLGTQQLAWDGPNAEIPQQSRLPREGAEDFHPAHCLRLRI